jgi:hypothetical protein
MHAAQAFTSSPSGWVILTLTGLVLALVGWFERRIVLTQDQHGAAITEAVKSLAVLVEGQTRNERSVLEAVADIDDLGAAVTMLQTWREIHERQAAEDRADLKSIIAGRTSVLHRPLG